MCVWELREVVWDSLCEQTLLPCVSQCCDLGFHASLARTFRTYLSAEYNLETSRHEGLDIIENAVDNLDARSDKHTIMDMCNQVFCPPLKFEFQPHMGDEVTGSPVGLCRACPAPPLDHPWEMVPHSLPLSAAFTHCCWCFLS